MAQLITANNIEPATLNILAGPKVSAIQYPGDDTAVSTSGGQTISLLGTNFQVGAVVHVDSVVVGVTTVVSSTLISFTTPAKSSGNYQLYVVNPDGGTASFLPGIQYSGTPSWTTAAGGLGTLYETESYNYSLSAVSDSAVSYTVTSGTLAAGATLNSATGSITGNANLVSGSTTYNFTVDAVDQEQQNTSRNFSVTVNPDVVTFNNPANASVYTATAGDSVSVTLNATSLMGKTISYQANSLPSGITLSANVISGTFATGGNSTTLVTATSSMTNKTSNISLNWVIAFPPPPPIGQISYTTPGTYSWTAPSGVTSVSVVAVGGGGSGGGGGGGLGWKNNIPVIPGQSYTVVVGGGGGFDSQSPGGDSFFISLATVSGRGGQGGSSTGGRLGGTYTGDGGGNGGGTNAKATNVWNGGGGAGGYSGNGGTGGGGTSSTLEAGSSGSGGGGGGGGADYSGNYGDLWVAGGGGGVGLLGQGATGAGGSVGAVGGQGAGAGTAGSGGENGGIGGGAYGGGGGGFYNAAAAGGGGAVRIIWGNDRAFPATNTGNL